MYYYQDILGTQSIEPNLAMTLGSLLHCRLHLLHADSTVSPNIIQMCKDNSGKYVADIKHIMSDMPDVPTSVLLLKGLIKGYSQIPSLELKGQIETRVMTIEEGYSLKSFTDLIVEDRIYDYKYCKNPDYYTKFTCENSSGIYLLHHPKAKSITFRLIRNPELKKGKSESDDEFVERMTNDILRRPKWYVTDKTFYRSEFDFNKIKKELISMSEEITLSIDKGMEYFRQNRSACYQPFMCDYLPLCESRLSPDKLPGKYRKREIY
jgi:hypothetical protein